ncbi:DUF1269 domain-containing protein [Methanofollis formosanus]|uniref:DUF1269 domain-containing protein n=1 Tax=Methanofollis formosanus TaxID=299308 RepID=A0A8G0ZYA2_9EURY|nr:DUF6325 family protein [Methanofollis formosanus]QYZ78157.1 DUF1269 domain-containing protein [Methanofollis formosanus]
MAFGPVQLFVIGFKDPDFHGEILEQLRKVREEGLLRLIDLQFVWKDEDGNISSFEATDLTDEEAARFGAVIGGLIGYGAAGREGARAGAEAGAMAVSERDLGLTEDDLEDISLSIPSNSAAAIMLVEHRWALELRDAIKSAGGVVLTQGMLTPEVLISVGAELAEAVEAAEEEEKKMKVPLAAR